MQYISSYESPLGEIILSADDIGLTGLWFKGQKHFTSNLIKKGKKQETEIIKNAREWLNIYFSGKDPNFKLPLYMIGTKFQVEVWEILCSIPYGKTITYGEIAKIMANKKGIKRMSAQAVGNAVGKNKISIIVPCHRVIGKNGNLTGYAAGINKKIELLKIENAYKNEFYI